SIEIIRRRIDETGTKEPTIQREGQDRILVQLPGVDNPGRVKALLGRTAKLSFQLVDQSVTVEDARRGRLPPGDEILPAAEEGRGSRGASSGGYVVRKRVMVGGDTLVDAQATFQNNEPVVSFKFDSIGGKKFGDATRENVGKPFAIVLDNKVISAPVIREPILGGSGIISGSFTVQSASDLALSLLGATLTLPGIAGIALTMGMAVDANVLIYERIKEELRGGRSMLSSLEAGFTRAFGTILDSHVTTLVAGILLYWLGSGPVKGFAVTLSIGVLTSLFSAILVTRLQIVTWLRRYKPRVIPL